VCLYVCLGGRGRGRGRSLGIGLNGRDRTNLVGGPDHWASWDCLWQRLLRFVLALVEV
jgi:hypothetical protein